VTSVVRSLEPQRTALQVPAWLTLSAAPRRDTARPTLLPYDTAYIIALGKSYRGRYFTAARFCLRVNCHWLTDWLTDARVQSKQSIMALATVGGSATNWWANEPCESTTPGRKELRKYEEVGHLASRDVPPTMILLLASVTASLSHQQYRLRPPGLRPTYSPRLIRAQPSVPVKSPLNNLLYAQNAEIQNTVPQLGPARSTNLSSRSNWNCL